MDKRIRVLPIKCGEIKHPQSKGILHRGQKLLPVWAYLIEHPKGVILLDTGTKDGNISEKLKSHGYNLEDIDFVTTSCFDPSQMGGLRSVARGVKKIILSYEEYYWTCRTVFARRQPRSNWEGLDFELFYPKGYESGPFKKCFDFFGDGSFNMYLCVGHSFGTSATMISNNGKFILLAGEVVLDGTTFEQGYVYDKGRQKKSVDWLKILSADPNCIATYASHDSHCSESWLEI